MSHVFYGLNTVILVDAVFYACRELVRHGDRISPTALLKKLGGMELKVAREVVRQIENGVENEEPCGNGFSYVFYVGN